MNTKCKTRGFIIARVPRTSQYFVPKVFQFSGYSPQPANHRMGTKNRIGRNYNWLIVFVTIKLLVHVKEVGYALEMNTRQIH